MSGALRAGVADRLGAAPAAAMRAAIMLAGGREVCFVCTLDEDGVVLNARVVARGDAACVLALPGFARRGEMLVHNHPSGLLEPSDADLGVAARLHDDGMGFGIVDNAVRELYVVVEVPRAADTARIDPDAIERDLGPDGPIAARLARYEDRPSQRTMAAAVARLYNEGGIGLLEAGTGIGKSLGYLVPALRWAAANGERTVVSTNTINLQEQLVGKDLPFLAEALSDQPVRFALLKGWRNFLCLLRLEQARGAEGVLFEDALTAELSSIARWAERTHDGTLSDLPSAPRSEVWDEVSAEPDLCIRMRCPHFDRCFLFKARREAAQADVIVVNHHLLLSDVAVRRAQQNWEEAAVLPSYSRLIVDEGHHLEDAAGAHLGATVSRRSLQRLFNRLERKGKGLLPALMARLQGNDDLLSTASLDLVHARLGPSVHAARDRASLLCDILEGWLRQGTATVVRLTDRFADDPLWAGGLGVTLDDLLSELDLIQDGLRVVGERMETARARDEGAESLLHEMRAVARRLDAAGDALRRALRAPAKDESVRWLELRGRERTLSATTVPLGLAPILREDLFERLETVVVTSATLAAEGRFGFLAGRLGLDEPGVAPVCQLLPSPFDFPRQALLALPRDLPAPNEDAAAHMSRTLAILRDLAEASDGGIFALFTSHRDVRTAAAVLRSRGADARWPLLVHGEEEGRDALLRRFRESGRAILLGTASFWEGVDVPGDPLRALLIARLPFRVPAEPITEAQCEAIEARGGNAFLEYMLPHASLRLKQGVGRLIRTATDRGVVVLTDPRVLSKRYGRELIEALPPLRRIAGPWNELLPAIRSFFERGT